MDLTSFEQALVTAAVAGDELEPATGLDVDVSSGGEWGYERSVRAEALEALITGVFGTVHRRGVRLKGGRIRGGLDLSWSQICQPLSLVKCYLDEPLSAKGAELVHLSLSGSQAPSVELQGTRVKRDVILDDGFSSTAVRLIGADIGGQLSIQRGTLDNRDGIALSADQATIGGGVLLDMGFSARGEVSLIGADIGGRLSVRGGTLDNPDGIALSAEQATIRGGVFLDLGFSARGEVSLHGADIRGALNGRRGVFDNASGVALSAERATIQGHVFLDGFQATGQVWLLGTHIGGQLSCKGGTVENPGGVALFAGGATVESAMFLDERFTARGEVRLPLADIGLLFWDDEYVEGMLSLENVTVRQLADRWGHLSLDGRGARLNGFRYESFREGTDDSVKLRLAWLRSSPDYTPQPYTQLAEVYRRSGHDDRAREVLIAREVDRRLQVTASRSSKAKSLFMGATIAHGYKPTRALVAILVLLFSGAVLLSGDPGRQAMVASKAPTTNQPTPLASTAARPKALTCPPDYPCFNPWVYSAETVIPLITLGQTDNWQPAGGLSRYQLWTWAATALGWLFTTLAVAGLTGVIRKD